MISQIFKKINQVPALKQIEQDLKLDNLSVVEGTDNLSAKIILVWYLFRKEKNILWLTKSPREAETRYVWLNKSIKNQVFLISNTGNRREDILGQNQLLNKMKNQKNWVVVCPIKNLITKNLISDRGLELKVGQELNLHRIIQWLEKVGYKRQERVILPGDYALRGGILDIFGIGENYGFRFELESSKIAQIYYLKIANQNLIKKVQKCQIQPIIGGQKDSWLKLLSHDAVFFIDEPDEIRQELDSLNFLNLGPSWSKLSKLIRQKIIFSHLPGLLGVPGRILSCYRSKVNRDSYLKLKEYFRQNQNQIIILTNFPEIILKNFPALESYDLILPESIILPEAKLEIITDREIFGPEIEEKPKRKITKKEKEFLASLKVGEILVHQNYGLGRYLGKVNLKLYDQSQEYLLLEYVDAARLFVPTNQVRLLTKYFAAFGISPKLSKLGGRSWLRLRKKVEEGTYELARELLQTASLRQRIRGFSFKLDPEWEKELTASFEYEETGDQIKAINAIYQDMESPKPMERLICGDVGFGKTEVAVRASLRAVASGKQVAFLAPTTILAEQHLATLQRRLKNFPVKIESLSRFKSKVLQRKIIKEIKTGKIDIVIGTHRLLQKDVEWADLGLVIIDEEQRFGVRQKERLKKLRAQVDILTLTATPIPRTLYLSLAGLKDISKIETSPEGRRPVETKISHFDIGLIKLAIQKELERRGQIYFVHNRIRTIYSMANKIKLMFPNAKIAMAHGQMAEADLAKIMQDFTAQKFNILVSTSIIENGLDLPKVNTIIVDQAEKFGLADLYHLRGRVGRGLIQAYAYFLVKTEHLNREAKQRLGAVLEAKNLGSGFEIALKDLEIRGGGNILGKEQHGHIVAVGLNLYSQFLENAIKKIKIIIN